MEKHYNNLLLDMDGTFLDFAAAERSAFFTAMKLHGHPACEEDYQLYTKINLSFWEAHERGEIDRPTLVVARFERYFEQKGICQDGAAFEEDYQRFLGEGHELMADAWEVLEYLRGRYELYVVTNGVEVTQRSRLHLSGIEGFMTDIFISGVVGFQKPRREFFDYCFERMENKDRDRTIIVGDSLTSDIQGGINAGIDTCWFNPSGKKRPDTWPEEARRAAGFADYEIRGLRELKELL